jgi:hypothetical protein
MQAVVETWGALEAFSEGDEKYSIVFGTNIIASIRGEITAVAADECSYGREVQPDNSGSPPDA